MGKRVIIIGGGAAGYFSAINIKDKNPKYQVTLIEKTSKTLTKVKISGGGRCNVTNGRQKPGNLVKFYPRGQKKLYKPFERFNTKDMQEWLYKRGVATYEEVDQRIFPTTNNSQTIIDCFEKEMDTLGIELIRNCAVKKIVKSTDWLIHTDTEIRAADAVVFSTGATKSGWRLLTELGLKTTQIVPSLFTFNIQDDRINELPGTSFPEATVRIIGSKFTETGPLLITHWGLSGPAILKLSSVAALHLNGCHYNFQIQINFSGQTAQALNEIIDQLKKVHPKKLIKNYKTNQIPHRYWERLVQKLKLTETPFAELTKKSQNRLIEELTQALFQVTGKSTFKEEFVSAGGIDLSEINFETMEAKRYPGLYLAGEVLDIDALTGGFNFQACWTAGWIISEAI